MLRGAPISVRRSSKEDILSAGYMVPAKTQDARVTPRQERALRSSDNLGLNFGGYRTIPRERQRDLCHLLRKKA